MAKETTDLGLTNVGEQLRSVHERPRCRLLDGREIVLEPGETTIGRTKDSMIVVAHPTVSRRHAVIRVRDGSVFVQDLGSSNGTFLNGRRLVDEERVADGDTLAAGVTDVLTFHIDPSSEVAYQRRSSDRSMRSSDELLEGMDRRQVLRDFERCLRAESHLLRQRPTLFFQVAANQPDYTAPARIARVRAREGHERRRWLRWINKPQHVPPEVLTIVGPRITWKHPAPELMHLDVAPVFERPVPLRGCRFSADGVRLLSWFSKSLINEEDWVGKFKVWDATSGIELGTWHLHDGEVMWCSVAPGTDRAASGAADRTLKVWDVSTGREVGAASCDGAASTVGAFDPSGTRLIVGFSDGTIGLFETAGLGMLVRESVHSSAVGSVAISANGSHAASASAGELVIAALHDTIVPIGRIQVGGEIRCCAWAPNAPIVLAGLQDGRALLYDPLGGTLLRSYEGHRSAVTHGAFLPDGTTIVTASVDKTLRLWNGASGHTAGVLEGHSGPVTGCDVSRDGRHISSASADGTLRVWETVSNGATEAAHGHAGSVSSCVFTPDGARVVSVADDGVVLRWELESNRIEQVGTTSEHTVQCAVTASGDLLLAARNNGGVQVWSGSTDRYVTTLNGEVPVAFSPRGDRIMITRDDTAVLLEVPGGREIARLLRTGEFGSHCDSTAGAFSPDGGMLVTTGDINSPTLFFWEAATGANIGYASGHACHVDGCVFSNDGGFVLIHASNRIEFWDVERRERTQQFDVDGPGFVSLTISSGGRIAAISEDAVLRIWNSRTMTLVLESPLAAAPTALAWSPDGLNLAVGCRNGRVMILRLQNFAGRRTSAGNWM